VTIRDSKNGGANSNRKRFVMRSTIKDISNGMLSQNQTCSLNTLNHPDDSNNKGMIVIRIPHMHLGEWNGIAWKFTYIEYQTIESLT